MTRHGNWRPRLWVEQPVERGQLVMASESQLGLITDLEQITFLGLSFLICQVGR